ncbi:cell envelope biogenesis protein OmpA [Aliidiomarina sedimenti]|uniref:Cell envelope biogenesis protein OmpA n=1 Tax=Aliidiomarina sedimenti TaxID=1933879 RepID=A0ABY0BXR2_9GAMM|nr:lipoprotein [Aliidiomarina sedimenti]RUO29148.1 cell envelope biogenesis protein OmpA [Aliidiomarina sedimenti]
MIKRIFHLVTVVSVVSALAGCGQKGPLYIPPEPETTDIEQQRDEADQSAQSQQSVSNNG